MGRSDSHVPNVLPLPELEVAERGDDGMEPVFGRDRMVDQPPPEDVLGDDRYESGIVGIVIERVTPSDTLGDQPGDFIDVFSGISMGSQTAISRSNRITFSARCAQVSRFDGQLLCRDELGIEDADARNVELLSGHCHGKGSEVTKARVTGSLRPQQSRSATLARPEP